MPAPAGMPGWPGIQTGGEGIPVDAGGGFCCSAPEREWAIPTGRRKQLLPVAGLQRIGRDSGRFVVQGATEEAQHLQRRVDDQRLRPVVFSDFEADRRLLARAYSPSTSLRWPLII